MPTPHIAVVGGGAAGFFAALTVAEAAPNARITLYERSRQFLAKVEISGGGRCNVTHHCFDPKELAAHYPRGTRELRAAFHRWQPSDTVDWFTRRGVKLKTEDDGRMFPVTDRSRTVIDCFLDQARKHRVRLLENAGLQSFAVEPDGRFTLERTDAQVDRADALCLAPGSLKSSPLARILESLGHTVEPLAPSLFAFNLADRRTHDLAGLSVRNATVHVVDRERPQTGPLLITHRGLSGPAILKLSAWEARALQDRNYHFDIAINWLGTVSENQLRETFNRQRKRKGKTPVRQKLFDELPRRLWERLLDAAGIPAGTQWSQLAKDRETRLVHELLDGRYAVQGKTTNKDEFVTCGGVRRNEIDWRTMESKLVPRLHFAGECIDYDGITGGFNFQGAWTTGRIAGEAMAHP